MQSSMSRFPVTSFKKLFEQRTSVPLLRKFSYDVGLNAALGESSKQAEEIKKEALEKARLDLLNEASALTKSLYRICLRSVREMRKGNESDEIRFREIEERQRSQSAQGIVPMSPPVNRANELHSRAEYYTEVACESVWRYAEILEDNPLSEQDIENFIFVLQRGEQRRQWVLREYQFNDPCEGVFDQERLNAFENHAKKYLALVDEMVDESDLNHNMYVLDEAEGDYEDSDDENDR